jgi:hypothetical protein
MEPIFLSNETEANLLEAVLNENGIPHFIKRYTDPSFQGLVTYKDKWGHVDTPENTRGRVISILREIRQSRKGAQGAM